MIPSDVRAYAQALLTTLPSQLLIPYLHPVFYSLHNMPTEVRSSLPLLYPLDTDIASLSRSAVPSRTRASSSLTLSRSPRSASNDTDFSSSKTVRTFSSGSVVTPSTASSRTSLTCLRTPSFGVGRCDSSFFSPPLYLLTRPLPTQRTLPVLDNAFSGRVNAIIGKVREARRGPYYPHLYVVKEDGEPALRQWALSCLIEDRIEALPSYQQWLGQLKDAVNDKSF